MGIFNIHPISVFSQDSNTVKFLDSSPNTLPPHQTPMISKNLLVHSTQHAASSLGVVQVTKDRGRSYGGPDPLRSLWEKTPKENAEQEDKA